MKEATVERTGTVDCDNCGIRVPATEAMLGSTRLPDGTEELVDALCSECAGHPDDRVYPTDAEVDAYYAELEAERKAEARAELQREHDGYLEGERITHEGYHGGWDVNGDDPEKF